MYILMIILGDFSTLISVVGKSSIRILHNKID